MKNSQLVKCQICGKEVFARGLKSHVRLQHSINLGFQIDVEQQNIDYEDLFALEGVTFEDAKQIMDFYNNIWNDEKTILKFVTWVNDKSCTPDMLNILKHFCIFLNNGGKTESELLAEG